MISIQELIDLAAAKLEAKQISPRKWAYFESGFYYVATRAEMSILGADLRNGMAEAYYTWRSTCSRQAKSAEIRAAKEFVK